MVTLYNPDNMRKERIEQAESILKSLPFKYCFITGSFLFKEKYKDIDLFIITRSKKEINPAKINKKLKITIIDFNDLYSLFYHSVSKSCVAKNILPKRELKATLADYWGIINEAVPTILNQKDRFHKDIRYLILYTEYFRSSQILDTHELNKKISEFKNNSQILDYISKNTPEIITKNANISYIKRFFYTQAGFYKDSSYKAQRLLYELTHSIING